ncbi:conserved Plasmodium protein, unknown function [Plasmodium reichenowi]|uniref:Surface-related antigen SRA n=1 Tax=Plasmodium reichenowi TaxID=5854 RepID=A0A2P9DPF4_PLARE|nr:conserved Plasmodium protein, unknown function [Plasmodium reichenowi]
MFLSSKKRRVFVLFMYFFVQNVNSNKSTNVSNNFSSNIATNLASSLATPLPTNVASHLIPNLVVPQQNNAAHVDSHKTISTNKHTCEAAGCSSYKDIIKNNSSSETSNGHQSNDGDCLNGFICKKCKKTHAKSPNICFYSSLDTYESLYEGILEDFKQTSYDSFKIPLDKSSKNIKSKGKHKNHNTNKEDNDNNDNNNNNNNNKDNNNKDNHNKKDTNGDEDDDDDDDNKKKHKGDKDDDRDDEEDNKSSTKKNNLKKKKKKSDEDNEETEDIDDEGEEDDQNEEDDEDNNNKKKKKFNNKTNNETDSFLEKYSKISFHTFLTPNKLTCKDIKEKKKGKKMKQRIYINNNKKNPACPLEPLEPSLIQYNIINLKTNKNETIDINNKVDTYKYTFSKYSFLKEEERIQEMVSNQKNDKKEEHVIHRRLKININKYEEYLKSKLNKCHISDDGIATIFIKLILQIVKNKSEIYIDPSKRSILNNNSSITTSTTKNNDNNNSNKEKHKYSDEDDEDNEDNEVNEVNEDNENDGYNSYGQKNKNNLSADYYDNENDNDEYGNKNKNSNQSYNYMSSQYNNNYNNQVNKYAYIQLLDKNYKNIYNTNNPIHKIHEKNYTYEKKYNQDKKNKILSTHVPNTTKYNFFEYHNVDDLEGDSMENYYKSKRGFFKNIFKKVFKRKKGKEGDEEEGEGEEEFHNEEVEPKGKKKKKKLFSIFRRKNKKNKSKNERDDSYNESNQREDNEDTYEESGEYNYEKKNNKRYDMDNDEIENDDEEDNDNNNNNNNNSYSYISNNKKKKKNDKKKKKFNKHKLKIKNFFTKLKQKVLPKKQKLHIEAFFNNIIVKSCKNSLKWKGKMFKKRSLIEMTLKVPVKIKYIEDEPLNFFRSGYEVILTCKNCEEILFNSCVQVYCTKTKTENDEKKNKKQTNTGATTPSFTTMASATSFAPLPEYNYKQLYPLNSNWSLSDYFSCDTHTYIKYSLVFLLMIFISIY